MPVYSRRGLGQTLAFNYIGDVMEGNNEGSLGDNAPAAFVHDNIFADLSLSGLGLYQGAYIYTNGQQYLIASFNVASGAFVSGARPRAALANTDIFGIHWLVPPLTKERMLTETIRHLRTRREITTPAVQGREFYGIDTLATLYGIQEVLEVYAYTDPTGSLTRGKVTVPWWQTQTTGSGLELRIYPALSSSWHLAVEAIVDMTLGASLDATIELPHQEWVLAGAAARCAETLTRPKPENAAIRRQRGTQPAPGYEPPPPGYWREKQREWAREFTRLSGIHSPRRDKRIQLSDPY